MLPFNRTSRQPGVSDARITPATCGTMNPRVPRGIPPPVTQERAPQGNRRPWQRSVVAATRLSADARTRTRARQREFLPFLENLTHLQQLFNSKTSSAARAIRQNERGRRERDTLRAPPQLSSKQ